ncbi:MULTISPECIES: hypothetical protein [unclassified Arenibacter]|jgi:hypothetical protein|uniref:hypothetical protein n=1 Tax=unclassified Arenibacter TaxID=2615047 RepID=UPI000E3446BC|nr:MULTISPECIES: hypothetical protein [unclassified Arenibacter]MCM4165751.1 hypothetical protein [Arenibacter sp. A80]RFT54600.1 hypothetical protein D0S24_19280 [Arenibacter sp. P308M17]
MRLSVITVYFVAGFVLTSFKGNQACEYAGSNIGYIQSQTEKALATEDINMSKYFAYKALNAIVKSKSQLEDCGCEHAIGLIHESAINLTNATGATSMPSVKILLKKALDNTLGGLEALNDHDSHNSRYNNDVLAMNTKTSMAEKELHDPLDKNSLETKVDIALEKFRKSLDKVVETVDCKEAKSFTQNVYRNCEKELMKPDLSEGKKYYNLKTKEIAANALKKLGNCQD